MKWVKIHNIYRCMHDAKAVEWSEPVAADAVTEFRNQRQMKHSDCYNVRPPAGPAGENLAWASYRLSPEQSSKMWYDEVKDCGRMPGCKSGATGVVGHFTAMIWDGVISIGCTSNDHNLVACRYKAGDSKDKNTPNMGGGYESNVFAKKRDESTCKRIVESCNIGGPDVGGGGGRTNPSGGGGGGGGGGNPRRRSGGGGG